MAMKSTLANLLKVILGLTIFTIAFAASATTSYTNHTVGDTAGWFFNSTSNSSAANYSDWASSQTFNLGDYLIFNTNTNQTVIQTYNETTYRSCSIDDSSDNDTFHYNGGSQKFGDALTVSVPLTIEGSNYFFSDASDGVQCQRGMAFEIQVAHGLGLPPALNQPPPPPYIEPPGPGSAQSPSVTTVEAQPPPSGGLRIRVKLTGGLCGILSLLLLF